MNDKSKKVAIIGAGPVGLEAALTAASRGYNFAVYESGAVGDAVRQWSHVAMFSPFELNSSERGRARLTAAGVDLPGPEAIMTGSEFRESYLLPLAQTLRPHVRENTRVLAIGRTRHLKGDQIGDPARDATSFRLLLRDEAGQRTATADLVLDCSGTFGQPNSLGDGGIPLPGEKTFGDRIRYGIPEEPLPGKRVLVIGSGHSAATSIRNLARESDRPLFWMIRRNRDLPLEELADDPLPERARLASEANQLVKDGRVRLLSDASVESLRRKGDDIEVTWRDSPGAEHTVVVDQIIAATGFRPDPTLARELQVHTCWATEGTYPLAASLLGEAGADCLAVPAFGAESLLHPEPGYFALGMKSYGRAPGFLLRTGYQQVRSVFDWLDERAES